MKAACRSGFTCVYVSSRRELQMPSDSIWFHFYSIIWSKGIFWAWFCDNRRGERSRTDSSDTCRYFSLSSPAGSEGALTSTRRMSDSFDRAGVDTTDTTHFSCPGCATLECGWWANLTAALELHLFVVDDLRLHPLHVPKAFGRDQSSPDHLV